MPALSFSNSQAKDAGLLDNKDVGGANKRRKTADGGGLATGGGEGGEEEEEEGEEEDEDAFLRRALESDEIDEETIKVGKERGKN